MWLIEDSSFICRAGGTAPVGQAKTGPLFSTTLVMIVLFINIFAINVVMIITISMVIKNNLQLQVLWPRGSATLS